MGMPNGYRKPDGFQQPALTARARDRNIGYESVGDQGLARFIGTPLGLPMIVTLFGGTKSSIRYDRSLEAMERTVKDNVPGKVEDVSRIGNGHGNWVYFEAKTSEGNHIVALRRNGKFVKARKL